MNKLNFIKADKPDCSNATDSGKITVTVREFITTTLAVDEMNIRNIMRIIKSDPENKVSLLLSHAGIDGSIADPWYTGNFDDTYRDVLLGCKALFNEIVD